MDRHGFKTIVLSLGVRFNSSIRDILTRLSRMTKRFNKRLEMLILTLIMFFNKEESYGSIYKERYPRSN